MEKNRLSFGWEKPYSVLLQFKRNAGKENGNQPDSFNLLFSRCEALTAYEFAFSRRCANPAVVAHVCSGIAFGGNYGNYPKSLGQALQNNKADLPRWFFYDRPAIDPEWGDHLALIPERYIEVERWGYKGGSFLALAEIDM